MKKTICIHLFFVLFCATAFAGVFSVSQFETTDVTPASFAVTWVASEPSTGALSVFASDCTTSVSGLSMVSEGSGTTGNLKVTAAGLSADTAYCYQTLTTSMSTSATTVYPVELAPNVTTTKAVLRTMITGTGSVPFANDLLKLPPVYLPAGSNAPDGVLEVLYLDGGNGPISLLLTKDASTHYFDMNNLFSASTGSSINLTGGERVRISERHGNNSCIIDRFRKVPTDQETAKAGNFISNTKPQDVDFNGAVNILDVLRVVGGAGAVNGDACFNSELDMMVHNMVDITDVQSVIGNFDATP